MSKTLSICLLAAALPVLPQESGKQAPKERPKIYSLKEDPSIVPPKIKYKEEPKYTTEAHDAKVQGTVILTLEVTEEGLPDNIAVKSGLDPGLDQNAVAAVRNWKFDPALKDGKPVRVKATMEINFRLQ